MPAGLERDELPPLRGDAVGARDVGKGDHAVGVADIEGVADQRHAERLAQSLHEDLARLRRRRRHRASRNSVMRLALTPSAAARRIVACIA